MTTKPHRSTGGDRRYEFICLVDALAPIVNARRMGSRLFTASLTITGSGIIFEQRGRTIGLGRLGACRTLTSKRTNATRLSASRHFAPDARRKPMAVATRMRREDAARAFTDRLLRPASRNLPIGFQLQ
jgi:hypothetical protein